MTGGLGFVQPQQRANDKLDVKVERTAQTAAKKKFSPEFMNRLDKIVVFHPLREEQLAQILEIELGMVQQRVLDAGHGQFLFRVTQAARNFLLQDGTDLKYGARHLKRAIERNVVFPLANLLATDQIRFGDRLVIDQEKNESDLSFHREGQGAVIPMPTRRPARPRPVRTVSRAASETEESVTASEPEPAVTR
jgi:ATP-dependent Clp protease ATP-binding subunit ClpA